MIKKNSKVQKEPTGMYPTARWEDEIDDDIKRDFIELTNKMWSFPQDDYLLVYHPEGSYLYGILSFINLLTYLGENIKGNGLYLQPAVIFSCLGSDKGSLGFDGKLHNIEKTHNYLRIEHIKFNKYQDWEISQGSPKVVLKIPKSLTPKDTPEIKFEKCTLRRHPQLRRILKSYFDIIKIPFDEKKLLVKLDELTLQFDTPRGLFDVESEENPYSFLDADELVLLSEDLYEGTYFQELPIELRKIIIEYVAIGAQISTSVINITGNPIINMVKNIQNVLTSTENASIGDIFNILERDGALTEINGAVLNGGADNLLGYLRNDLGMDNIIGSLMDGFNSSNNNSGSL